MAAHSVTTLSFPTVGERSYRFIGGGTPMRDMVRDFPWQNTALGAIDDWSAALRTSVGIVMHSVHPMFLWWGDELTQVYNCLLYTSPSPRD